VTLQQVAYHTAFFHDLIDTRSSVAVEQEPVLKNHETSLIETRGYEFFLFYFILFIYFV